MTSQNSTCITIFQPFQIMYEVLGIFKDSSGVPGSRVPGLGGDLRGHRKPSSPLLELFMLQDSLGDPGRFYGKLIPTGEQCMLLRDIDIQNADKAKMDMGYMAEITLGELPEYEIMACFPLQSD
ncbi:hypothetical protein HYFRA_00010900 [Hymenoscyphus fraxineus]|uniref:Uncharacterized protein n=1 Tax=Hymenoscyphus fraxineus TaxID=746836 RepID=A0A9N9KU41_9HELO|nr:hypothetical protein HYFRA_00010900 [Hymenoscyphus fraxineus]